MKRPVRRIVRRVLRWLLLLLLGLHVACGLGFLTLRWIDPPFTMVHVQRRIESWVDSGTYKKRYSFVPLRRISPHLQHAVIAAEDGGFYRHRGIDWAEVGKVAEDALDRGRVRGASTISQQLVKNLFFTTHGSVVRKALEFTLVHIEELVLPKRRILELYLNVIEWGPGVYGAEAAARFHYGVSAAGVRREQAARLAAILPAPRVRKPTLMNDYSAIILGRMSRMGW